MHNTKKNFQLHYLNIIFTVLVNNKGNIFFKQSIYKLEVYKNKFLQPDTLGECKISLIWINPTKHQGGNLYYVQWNKL